MNEQIIEDYDILIREYFECRKAQFLLNKLIVPIEEKQLFDRKNQTQTQLLYLLICRCKYNVDRALQMVKKHYDEEMFEFFTNQVSNLEERIRLKFQFITDLLTGIQSKFGSILKEKVNKLISKKNFNEREKFLSGEEDVDYTREEHIKYVYAKYVLIVLKELKGEEVEKSEVKDLLKAFERIALLQEK